MELIEPTLSSFSPFIIPAVQSVHLAPCLFPGRIFIHLGAKSGYPRREAVTLTVGDVKVHSPAPPAGTVPVTAVYLPHLTAQPHRSPF